MTWQAGKDATAEETHDWKYLSLLNTSCLADAAETAIGRDPVDTQIRSAFSPIVNPVLSTTARRPTTATATAVAAGPASPLVSCSVHFHQYVQVLQNLHVFHYLRRISSISLRGAGPASPMVNQTFPVHAAERRCLCQTGLLELTGEAGALQRLFADNIGSRIVNGIATMLLNGPVSRTIINGIAASPFAHLFLDGVSGAAAVVGPIETNMLVRVSSTTRELLLHKYTKVRDAHFLHPISCEIAARARQCLYRRCRPFWAHGCGEPRQERRFRRQRQRAPT